MATSQIYDAVDASVYVAATLAGLADSSSLRTDVFCETLALRLAPQTCTAVLKHFAGRICAQGRSAFTNVLPLDLRGKYVKIAVAGTTMFYGIIPIQDDDIMGAKTNSAGTVYNQDNYYTAYSLDFLLDKIYIDKSHVYNGTTVVEIDTVFAFNGDGPELVENRYTTKDADNCYTFNFAKTEVDLWAASDFLEYMLYKFAALTGHSWTIAGDYSTLTRYTIQLDPQGKTVRQCLNEIFKPGMGYSFYVTSDGTNPIIYIVSVSDQDIDIGATTVIPANARTTSITSEVEQDRRIESFRLSRVEQSAYNYIKVRSEPVRVMATLDFITGNLEPDWTEALETAFGSAVERLRQGETYEKVFSAFTLPEDWAGSDYNGLDILPAVDSSTLDVTFASGNQFITRAHVFDRSLPLRKTSTDKLDDFKKPILFVKDSNDDYHVADKITFDGEKAPSIGFSVLDDKCGIQARPPYRHILGENHFEGTSDYEALYDYEDCLLTVSFYTDAVLAYEIAGASASGISKTKVIEIPGYHYWVAAPETKLDVSTDTGESWTVIRDDREKLKEFAALAKAWYGRLRNTFTSSRQRIYAFNYLGYMVTSITSGGSFTPIGTVISSIDYNFSAQHLAISSDFYDLDFQRLAKRNANTTTGNMARRISRLEERTYNLPVREAAGGSSGDATYDGPFAVVKKDDTTVTVYGYNLDAGRLFNSYIDLGTDRIEFTEADVIITASGWVYLDITYSSPNYAASAAFAAAFPSQSTTHQYIDLAYVLFSDGIITSILQTRTGLQILPGRAM